jgi:hypothetical protein
MAVTSEANGQAGAVAHVILTRFNLATPGRESRIRNQPGWLEDRFELFERYCLPSVAAQTRHEFTWLIFFDAETPDAFKRRIAGCQKTYPFVPVFTGLFQSAGWGRAVREHVEARPGWVLTTRLDNDDAIAVDFCERLAAAARHHPGPCALNFTNGFVLSRGRVYAHRHPTNAFASYMEPLNDAVRTVCTIPHMELADVVPVHQIGGPGAWLQVVHGRNVSNKVRGYRVSGEELEARFPPAVKAGLDGHGAQARLENAVLWPGRLARDMAVTMLRRGIRSVRGG